MAGGFPPRRWGPPRVEVFAVEPHATQITWAGLSPGEVRVRVGDQEAVVPSAGEPGGVVVDDLEAGRRLPVVVSVGPRRWEREIVTPWPPDGEELFRLGTVSDVHLGHRGFGLSHRMRERDPVEIPHPERCGAAALAEGEAWGARRIVVKGDLVERGRADEWEAADRVLSAVGVPVWCVPGNHEVKPGRDHDAPARLAVSGAEMVDGVAHHDLPGVRLVLVDSTVDGHGRGAVDHRLDEVVAAVGETDLPVLVMLHQHPQRFERPWFWPPGIPGAEARRFLDAVAGANPRAFVTSGHTHRNRVWRRGSIVTTEVGSTKDFPGVWGGYTVYDGGIVQTVRRTLAPDAIAWTEYTRRAVLGVWGRWSPGTLADRCVVARW